MRKQSTEKQKLLNQQNIKKPNKNNLIHGCLKGRERVYLI